MTSSSELAAAGYLEALKQLLKERGVTYAHLARALGCSLPTVKRALNKPSLPFSRLLEVCEAAGLAFEDLHRRAERLRPRHFTFTDEQDRLFAEREELLAYFLELAREGAAPEAIAARHGLDPRSTELYLAHLARVGLVERRPDGGARPLARPPFGFAPGSRVLRRRHARFLEAVVADVLAADPARRERGAVAVLKPLRLTRGDYERMVGELEAVVTRYAAIAERGLGRGRVQPWRLALACGPAPEPPEPRLPKITS